MPIDYDQLAQQHGGTTTVDYDALARQHGGSEGGSAPPEEAAPPQPLMSQVEEGAKDFGKGVLKGAGSTMSAADDWSRKHLPAFMTNTGMGFGKPEDIPAEKQMLEPSGTAQAIGKGVEQAGEFLVPGAAEEEATRLIPKAAPEILRPAARVGAAALSSGAINKMQGGNFGTGAVAGGIGAGLGEGMKALAPGLAEGAMKIRKIDRIGEKTPGRAILDETTGVRPDSVADSARGKIKELNSGYEAAANASTGQTTLDPAIQEVDAAIAKATKQNNAKALAQLQPIRDALTQHVSGGPLSAIQTPGAMLDLKRGFGDQFVHSWNPEVTDSVNRTGKMAYRAMDNELDNAIPDSAETNRRISSLIPVAKRAESTARNADTGQRIMSRIGAHTGAATLGGLGAVQGYREHGIEGGILGGMAGIAAPELISSPTGQMSIARALNSPITQKALVPLVRGGALQLDRHPH